MARTSTEVLKALGGLTVQYQRDDIYYCNGCGRFYDNLTDKLVHVELWELPAEFALEVMADRQQRYTFCHARKRAKAIKVKGRGFGKLSS